MTTLLRFTRWLLAAFRPEVSVAHAALPDDEDRSSLADLVSLLKKAEQDNPPK
jgi:hypothetical protein